MALIDKDEAVVAVRELFKANPTRAIRAMYAIRELEEVEAIPVEWIENYIKKLQESFVSLTGWPAIEVMLKKWREELKNERIDRASGGD